MSAVYHDNLIIIRGGGDLATGVAVRLFNSGFDVFILESGAPTSIRRTVCLGQAVYDGEAEVEGIKAELRDGFVYPEGYIPVMIDADMKVLETVRPLALVDAVIAKRNIGLRKDLCDIVVALGPGFAAGIDCHAVVETMRGHNLGRVIYKGFALPDTGTPGLINGIAGERVIHAGHAGKLKIIKDIGSIVKESETIAEIDGHPVKATINGLVRGMIRDGFRVYKGMKIADIDPREKELSNCHTVSDKARALGGAVLEAVLNLRRKNG